VPVTTETKCNLIENFAEQAEASGVSLLSILKDARREVVAQLMAGKILIEARGEGVMARYEVPVGRGPLRLQDVGDAISELISLYRVVSGSLVSPTDAEILSGMLGQLTIVRSCGWDFSTSLCR